MSGHAFRPRRTTTTSDPSPRDARAASIHMLRATRFARRRREEERSGHVLRPRATTNKAAARRETAVSEASHQDRANRAPRRSEER